MIFYYMSVIIAHANAYNVENIEKHQRRQRCWFEK